MAAHFKMTPRELLRRFDAHELAEYEALMTFDPWGELRQDIRTGIEAAAMVNAWGGKAKPTDFMPFFKEPEKELTPDEEQKRLVEKVKIFAAVMNQRFQDTKG